MMIIMPYADLPSPVGPSIRGAKILDASNASEQVRHLVGAEITSKWFYYSSTTVAKPNRRLRRSRAFFESVVGFPCLSKATPSGIFWLFLAATLILPLLIIEIDVSSIKGILDPVGHPKQIGFVPNKLFNAP